MTTRHDVEKAIEEVDVRLLEMTPRLVTHRDAKLLENDWHVREALCHLAARANSVPLAQTAREGARTRGNDGVVTGAFGDVDEMNRRQIEERRDRRGRRATRLDAHDH